MYTLSPSPVPRHKVTVTSLTVLKLAVWNVVHAVCQVGVGKDVMDDLAGIVIPELVVVGHPLGDGPTLGIETVVACSV